MNNYNNNNNFIGTTHLDNYKITSNFVISTSNTLASNSSNYTNYTSNILATNSSNYTKSTSNILENHLLTVSNYFKNLIDNYNDGTNFNGAINTNIYNNNTLGEIRFITSNAPSYFGGNYKFITKIGENGVLYVYNAYDPTHPTVLPGWYSVADTIKDNYAFQAQTNTLLITIQNEINTLNATSVALETNVGIINNSVLTLQEEVLFLNNLNHIREFSINTFPELMESLDIARNSHYFDIFPNPIIATNIGIGGAIGIAGGIIGSVLYANYISGQVQILSNADNSNLSSTQKQTLIDGYNNITSDSVNSFNSNLSNLNLLQGFINSNIITPQTIPKIETKYIHYNSTNLAPPSIGVYGGYGDKIVLSNGTNNTYPYSIGNDSNSLWISSPSNINFYSNGNKSVSITSNNELWVTGRIKENNDYLSNIYTTPNSATNLILYNTPNVVKKFGFTFTCSTILNYGGTIYYKYDIDLRKYTQTKTTTNPSSYYRIFNIKLFLATAYFEVKLNNEYNVLSYEIYMSNEANAGMVIGGTQVGTQGINIYAIGTPPNPNLSNFLPCYFSLMRTSDFNYLVFLSLVQNTNINCIIEDLLF